MTATAQPENVGDGRIGTWVRDKYLIEAVLGSGGMATVYAARHRNKKRVALKMLHSELSGHADVRARFLREGYVANTVDHPGAVAVLDEDVAEDGSAFLVMEFLDGASLESISETLGPLPLDCILVAAFQTLDVLAAAHAKHVVHRDIKPANLFLTREGRIKVLDYGIARLREADVSTTRTGTSMGTPAFMSPEQASGQASLVDEQSDLWSLGATMYTLLTGLFVHDGETPQHMMVLAATQAPKLVSSSAPELPTLAGALIDRALAFDKAARWPSALAMRDAVGDVYSALFDQPPSTGPLVDLAIRAVPVSYRSGHALTDATRIAHATPSAKPVQALPAGKPLDITVHGAHDPSAHRKKLVAIGLGGVALLGLATVPFVLRRPMPENAVVEPRALPSSSPQVVATAPATGVVVAEPVVPEAVVAPGPSASSPAPVATVGSSATAASPTTRPPPSARPHHGPAAPSAQASATSAPAPNDFDRQ